VQLLAYSLFVDELMRTFVLNLCVVCEAGEKLEKSWCRKIWLGEWKSTPGVEKISLHSVVRA